MYAVNLCPHSVRRPANDRRSFPSIAPSNLPSSRDNAATVRAVYAAFSGLAQGGEIASYVAAHFDSDCEYRPVEEASTIRGHDALIRWVERWLEAWDDAWDRWTS